MGFIHSFYGTWFATPAPQRNILDDSAISNDKPKICKETSADDYREVSPVRNSGSERNENF